MYFTTKFGGDYGKSDVLEHKSGNISERRKDRAKVGGPIGTHQRSFERYHLGPLYTISLYLCTANPFIYATNTKFDPVKPIKNFGEKGAWAYLRAADIFWLPL